MFGYNKDVLRESIKEARCSILEVLYEVCYRLSGQSPFHKDNHRDTLLAVQEGKFEFTEDAFSNISADAKDFITKLLTKDPK